MADNLTAPANGAVLATDEEAGVHYPLSKAVMTAGGNISAQTASTGTNWTTFASQACRQLTLLNDSGAKIEFRQGGGGVGIPIRDGGSFSVFGLTNANEIGVRRADTSNTQVTVHARWEG